MDASKRLVRKASNGMMNMAASTSAAITSHTRRLSDAMKPEIDLNQLPQLKRKISGALSRSDSSKSQNSQKSSESQHRRRPSFQGGQLVPRDNIQYFPREEVLSPNHIGSRARSGDYGDLIDGVAIAEAARRDKERRFYGSQRQRSASLDTNGYSIEHGGPDYASRTSGHGHGARGPPSQPVPDSVLPGEKMRDSVNSIAFSRTDSSGSMYSQMSTATGIEFEIDVINKGLRQFKIEKEIASGRGVACDARGVAPPCGASVQRKGAIKRNMSSDSVAPARRESPYMDPRLATSKTHARTFSVEPADDFGRYPRIASNHSRDASSSSGSLTTSSRGRQEQTNLARPTVYHPTTAPTRLPSQHPTDPRTLPMSPPASAPSHARSRSASQENVAMSTSSRHAHSKSNIEGPPPSSSSGSSGYSRNEHSTHKSSRNRDSDSGMWLSRTARPPQDKLAKNLLGGTPQHEREQEPAVIYKILTPPTGPHTPSRSLDVTRHTSSQPPASSPSRIPSQSPTHSPQPPSRPSSTRPSSTRASHRPPPLVSAFASPFRASTASAAFPPTPPPLPASSINDPLGRHASPGLALSSAAPAQRAQLRAAHVASTASCAGEVGRVEWRASYQLGADNIRARKTSDAGRAEAERGEREQEGEGRARRAYF